MPERKLFVIPFRDKFLIYRPLLSISFLGNRQLADLAEAWCANGDDDVLKEYPEVRQYFSEIGFLRDDVQIATNRYKAQPFKPTSAALLMTNRCNLRCIYCYANGGEENMLDLPPELGKKAIDIVAQNALECGQDQFSVTFHGGGEPTLPWKTLLELGAYARTKKTRAHLSLVSNGVWSEEQCSTLMGLLDGLTISMDGAADTQNLQRPDAGGTGSFTRVMRTIEQLSAAHFPFNIRVTSTAARFEFIPEDVRFLCEKTGCRIIQVEPAFNHQRGRHSQVIREEGERFCSAFLEAYDIARDLKKDIYYSGARPAVLTDEFCSAPMGGSLTVNPLGEVVACYEITGRKGQLNAVLGSLDQNGLRVDEEDRQKFMDGISARKERCKDCFCYYHCAGDCFTRGMPNPDGLWPYTRCEINRAVTLGLLLRGIAARS